MLLRNGKTLVLLPLLLLLGAGCAVRHDAGELAHRRVSGTRVDSSVGEYSLFGLHTDRGPDWQRTRRAEHLTLDPKNALTAREQRYARATAEAEARLVRQGGLMLYRWDGSASKPTEVQYVESPGALTVNYTASEKLNCIDGEPHALVLVVYHLSDRAAFDQLAEHEDGIRKLLEGEKFDAAVKRVRTYTAQPASKGELLFDRPEGGRFVAIVAGYADLEVETSIYVTEYGIGRWEKPGSTIWSRGTYMFNPLPLTIDASLGQSGMATRNSGSLLGKFQKTQELDFSQLQHIVLEELGWNKTAIGVGDSVK